jgi:uncharacterized protein YqeY
MTMEEVTLLVKNIIAETGAASAADFGKVMPAVMKQVKGKADGRAVQELVKTLLGS